MSKKIRHLIAFLLLWVFFTPVAGKLLDETFHHHYFFHTRVKGQVVHLYHRACPIPGFTLSFFTAQKPIHPREKQAHFTRVYPGYRPARFSSLLDYATLLRAPPLSDGLL